MLADSAHPYAWSFFWLTLVTALYYGSQTTIFKSAQHRIGARFFPAGVLIASLACRLVPTLLLPVGATYDIDSFRLVAEAMLRNEDLYSAASVMGRHPYLPFQAYIIAGAMLAASATRIPFVVVVKLPALVADMAITATVYRVCRRRGNRVTAASSAALLYALNPISILATAYHGQFDAIPVLFLLIAWYLWRFGRRMMPSAIALAFGVQSKTWPVLFLPVVAIRARGRRFAIGYVTVVLGVPLLLTALYLVAFGGDPRPLFGRALTHTGVPGYWGITGLLALAKESVRGADGLYAGYVGMRRIILLATGLGALWATRRQSGLDALTTLILCVLAVTAGMGLQWLLWVVPFALLAGDVRGLNYYSLASCIYLTLQLYGLHFNAWVFQAFDPPIAHALIIVSALPAWAAVVAWAMWRLFREPSAVFS